VVSDQGTAVPDRNDDSGLLDATVASRRDRLHCTVDFGLIYDFTPSQGPPSTLGAVHNRIIRDFILLFFYILLALGPGGFLYLLWVLLRSVGPINRLLKTIKNGLLAFIQNVSRVFTEFAESRAAPAWIQVSINALLKLCKPFSLCRHPPC